MMTGEFFRDIKQQIVELYHTTRGKNLVTFVVFLCISAFFWLLMALNDVLQRDFVLPVIIDNLPANVTTLNQEPVKVSVSLKDKGSSLIRYQWGDTPELHFNFEDINTPGYSLYITPQKLNNAIRQIFGQATVTSMKPDSISIPFTRRRGKVVDVKIEKGEISAAPQFIISGPVRLLTDTVKLFSVHKITGMSSVKTSPVSAIGLIDTTVVDVTLQVPRGMRAIPATVRVMIPVEPLIVRKVSIPIEVTNVPVGRNVVTFPSKVDVTYFVPMSVYDESEHCPLVALADYRRRSDFSSKLPLRISNLPDSYRDVELEADSVEYLIEQH